MQKQSTKAAYLVKQAARTRFSFGPVWTEAVKAGTVKDRAKLVAHAVKLGVGARSTMIKLSTPALLSKVQKTLASQTAIS